MTRNRSIDAFRGLSIVGMVFFTLTLRLGHDLPEPLRHNIPTSIHLGDLILPMFLFASGISLGYYMEKRKDEGRSDFSSGVLKRFATLVLIAVLLSYFSARGFLEMDEVMLNALLFLACVALSSLDWKASLGVIFLIDLSYLALIDPGWIGAESTNIFSGHYLGGYPAAIYYLPVMLGGLVLGRGMISGGVWSGSNKMTMGAILALLVFSWAFVPLDKMVATPSFMMLSILFCFGVFVLIDKVTQRMNGLEELEYLGRKPLRYWIMMYVFFLIPLMLYGDLTGLTVTPKIYCPLSVMISLSVLIILWLASKAYDELMVRRLKTHLEAEK